MSRKFRQKQETAKHQNTQEVKSFDVPQEARSFEKVIGFLSLHPHVEKVYVNAAGEYHLSPVDGFDEYTADNLLNNEGTQEEPENEETQEEPENKGTSEDDQN